ncbi:MAG: hypothetical protein C3F17_10485 [Bradyrhizobiaceae bacterium]|nr:MAG: hypothetical protein C3F17_10485 [Bradyrhizobiaceae bacterium]
MRTPHPIALPLAAALCIALAPLPAGSRGQGCDLVAGPAGMPEPSYSATARKACAIYLNIATDAQ